MRALLSALLALAQAIPAALPASGSLEVEARGTHVSVRANRVPLNRILDRLAQQTGMKVTYDATPPAQPVTTTIEGLPARDAIVRLMEGLGVAYVFRTDRSGQRVETLIVTEANASGSSTASSGSSAAVQYPAEVIEEVVEYQEPPPEMAVPMELSAPPPPGMPAPDLALPGMPGYQGIPQYPGPGQTGGTGSNPNYPQYPSGISYPN